MKSKLIFVCLLVVASTTLIITFCIFMWSNKCASTNNLHVIPRFGKLLPAIGTCDILYEYNPRYEFLDATFNCGTNVFYEICVQKKLSTLCYESGFDRGGLLTENKLFVPVGTRVWCAWGMLNPPTRFTLHLFFEPPYPNSSNSNGVMFLHVR